MREILAVIKKVAPTQATVLITGETGTGKELLAALIHFGSQRNKAPFVKVNCAALHENLLESELFGHERGAFTGAEKLRIGRFEQADKGTIFLDEIGDMSSTTQAKVLRVLQEQEFERLGSSGRSVKVDVRVVAATNKDLRIEVKEGRFRQDLYFRLNVVNLRIPPLRERLDDILPLARFFLDRYAVDFKKKVSGFSPEAIEKIRQYSWPGNVRELQNSIERAVLLSDGGNGRCPQPDPGGAYPWGGGYCRGHDESGGTGTGGDRTGVAVIQGCPEGSREIDGRHPPRPELQDRRDEDRLEIVSGEVMRRVNSNFKLLFVSLPSPPGESDQETSKKDHRAGLENVCPDHRSGFQRSDGGRRHQEIIDEQEEEKQGDPNCLLRVRIHHRTPPANL